MVGGIKARSILAVIGNVEAAKGCVEEQAKLVRIRLLPFTSAAPHRDCAISSPA